MHTWLVNKVVDKIDLKTLADQVEVKLADRLNERIDSRLRGHKIKDAIVDKIRSPSNTIYGITGERIQHSGPYFLKEDPQLPGVIGGDAFSFYFPLPLVAVAFYLGGLKASRI